MTPTDKRKPPFESRLTPYQRRRLKALGFPWLERYRGLEEWWASTPDLSPITIWILVSSSGPLTYRMCHNNHLRTLRAETNYSPTVTTLRELAAIVVEFRLTGETIGGTQR